MAFEPQAGGMIAGRYLLEEPIGGGGMGRVWRATDQVLDCPIAIKLVIEDDDATSRYRQIDRFMREAKLSASVQHPAVVRVTDFGVHEDTPFIAMELLSGESLASRLERKPLSQNEAVGVCMAILRGLRAAHQVGVVHRDIKPENIQLVEDVDGLYPKLIDFGISLGTVQQRRVSAVTTNGFVFGTPMYMSPEQARGLDVDGRTDLYGVGVVLYEMLAGRPPFPYTSAVDLIAALARDVPTAPHDVRPEVPLSLSKVVMKAIEKEPIDRYQSAAEMATALLAASNALTDASGPVLIERPSVSTKQRTLGPSDGMVSGPSERHPTLGARIADTLGVPALASSRAPWWGAAALLTVLLVVAFWTLVPSTEATSQNVEVGPGDLELETEGQDEDAVLEGAVSGAPVAGDDDEVEETQPPQADGDELPAQDDEEAPAAVMASEMVVQTATPRERERRPTHPTSMQGHSRMNAPEDTMAAEPTMVEMESSVMDEAAMDSTMQPGFFELDY